MVSNPLRCDLFKLNTFIVVIEESTLPSKSNFLCSDPSEPEYVLSLTLY